MQTFDQINQAITSLAPVAIPAGALSLLFAAFQLGSKHWRALYLAKDTDCRAKDKELSDLRQDGRELAEQYMKGTDKILLAKINALTRDLLDLKSKLTEKEEELADLLSRSNSEREKIEAIEEERAILEQKASAFEQTLSLLLARREVVDAVLASFTKGDLKVDDLPILDEELRNRLKSIDGQPRPKLTAYVRASMVEPRQRQRADSVRAMIERADAKRKAEQSAKRSRTVAVPLVHDESINAAEERPTRAGGALFAVGTAITGRPPHRSGRAQLRHPAPTEGI